MSTDPICVRCGHPLSEHTESERGCAHVDITYMGLPHKRGCSCAEYQVPNEEAETGTVTIDRSLLEAIHAELEKDWRNATLTRHVNTILHPISEELTVRERVAQAMAEAETWGGAIDTAIATIYDAIVRTSFPVARTTVPQQLDAFMAGAERQRAAILKMLNPERETS